MPENLSSSKSHFPPRVWPHPRRQAPPFLSRAATNRHESTRPTGASMAAVTGAADLQRLLTSAPAAPQLLHISTPASRAAPMELATLSVGPD